MKLIKNSFLFFYAFVLCFSARNLHAQQIKDSISHYYSLYINPKGSNDLKKAYTFFNQRKEVNNQKKDTTKLVFNLRILASIEYKFGNLHKSDATAISALELIDNIKNTNTTVEAKIGVLNHLGIVSYELGNYDRALDLYDRVLKIAKNPRQINSVLNNKANIYRKKKNYRLSIEQFEKVYENNLKFDDKLKIARSLDNLGLAESKLNYTNALDKMLAALKIREEEQNIDELFVSYKHLSEYFTDRKATKKAKHYANKAYKIAKKTKNASYKLEALSLLLNADNQLQVIEFKKLSDSINLAKQKNENMFASMQYDYMEEKRKANEAKLQLAESKLDEEKQKRFKIIYLSGGSFILLSSIFLYFILKSRHKKEKLIEVYKTETRISKKVHDEVANDVYHVMTKLQSSKTINEDVLDDLEDIYTKTRDISKENSAIDVTENFNEILNDLLLSYRSTDINVITKNISKVDWQKISNEKKTALYRVLQELMTNMKKHSSASIVVLAFNQSEKLTINYSDNGVGCIIKKNNGLQNVENRIKTINGTIKFKSQVNGGFKAKILI
ncbi:tetratricopeptide repeat protein [Polaribacter sp. R77954]|uniref:tetratricopeptide repeat-containing sensor histidine kinase n=1 Tax=Polaribacter sp. R77954 TaxID=3093870 RepID=UPI0037C78EE7